MGSCCSPALQKHAQVDQETHMLYISVVFQNVCKVGPS